MNDIFLLPIVMLAVVQPNESDHVTVIKAYSTAAECISSIPTVRAGWEEDRPDAIFWCADPIGRAIYPDYTAEP